MNKRLLSFLIVLSVLLTGCALRPAEYTRETSPAESTVPVQSTGSSAETSGENTVEDTTAPAVEESSVSFVACGDNIIYYGTYRDAASQAYAGGRAYNFRPIYKNVEGIISSADISFINQETPCAQSFQPESYPTFNSPVDLTYDVCDVGFDIINLANNHMLDKGSKGLSESYENWKSRGVCVIGCYEENSEGNYITYYEKNGINIALLSYTYGTNLGDDPANAGLYAPYLRHSDVEGDVKRAKESADFVIVSVHWGDEGAKTPNDEQKKYAQLMADSGADVILGHHPHVLQPIEWLQGKDGNSTLCAYSLGNFVHEQAYDYNVPGGILSFNIVKTSEGTTAADPVLIPTVCHYPANFYNNTVYLFRDYTADLANAHAVRTYYNNPISYDSLKSYICQTISAEFLPDYMK